MRRSLIEEQNGYLIERQRQFRFAADLLVDALAHFAEVEAAAVIGSVAKPLWKEVPRFREFRREGIEVWHECGDVDLAVWLSDQQRLGMMRRAAEKALRDAHLSGKGISVAGHQADIFPFEPGTDRYLGRLCNYAQCPKNKPDCFVPGCGDVPHNKVVEGFVPYPDILSGAENGMLYRRGQGRLRSALDLPMPDDVPRGS